jgi:hypothetical protein
MRHLLADTSRVTSVTIGDLDPDAVRKALQAAAVDTAAMPETTLRLLCVPLHFAVFSRLSPEAQRIPYRTLPELYDRYTSELRQQAERQAGHLDWAGITAALVGYMNEHESLLAPEAVLDNAARGEVNTLVSVGVLVRDGHRVGFFHETYFDYLFAHAFVTQGRDLHDFLAGSGQHLFRRAQARQVLEYLAATDRGAFRRAAVGLLTSERIRPHLHDVVARVLSELDADLDDLRALEPVMFDGAGGQAKLLPLLSSPAWFDAADQADRWETWLAAKATADKAGHQLIVAARSRPERVTALAGHQRRHHVAPGGPEDVDGHDAELDLGVFQQLLGPVLFRGPGGYHISGSGSGPEPAHGLRGTKLERSICRSATLHSQTASSRSDLRRPGRCLTSLAFTSHVSNPAASSR